jgi:hypothetical protein
MMDVSNHNKWYYMSQAQALQGSVQNWKTLCFFISGMCLGVATLLILVVYRYENLQHKYNTEIRQYQGNAKAEG